MSTTPESEINLDLHFLPAWAKQSPEVNRYADFAGHEDRGRRGDRGDRGRREGGRPGGGPRPQRREGFGGRPTGPGGGGGGPRGGQGRGGPGRGPGPGGRREFVAEKPEVLPEVSVHFTPEEFGVESLARQIRFTGRAYPVFDIAHLVLSKPERYRVTFRVVKKPDGQPVQALWLCSVDDTLWLSQEEAVQHVVRKHFDMFYQAEKTPTDPPKGTYTFVAQCGLSGVVLGPPNFHDYQAKLHKLHASRFARMPFEAFKAKVRIVRDEATVKKWVEDQSFRTEYVCLNLPEPLRLGSVEEAEKHFQEVHAPNLLRQVETWSVGGALAQQQPARLIRQLVRRAWEEQHRFPLRVVTVLSQQFASHGLQFFKVNKTFTHVAVARPHYLDMELTPVSDGVKRIVQHIETHEGCNRRQLVEALAPTPLAPPAPAVAVVVPPPAPAPSVAEAAQAGAESAAAATPPSAPAAPAEPQPTPEQTAVVADLHWLIHQGHVIEFANGRLETAKKPKPRPVKPPTPVQETAVAAAAKPAATGSDVAPPAPASAQVPVDVESAHEQSVPEAAAPEAAEPTAEVQPAPEAAAPMAAPESAVPVPAPAEGVAPVLTPPLESASAESGEVKS